MDRDEHMNATIRPARSSDIPFLVESALAAEKSGGEHAPIARLFGLDEHTVRGLITAMFEEEIDGCEFGLSSFLVVDNGVGPEATVAGWIEGVNEDDMPSQLLRANLIGFTFPAEAMEHLRANGPAVSALAIPRQRGALQIEYVHVAPTARGKGYAKSLIQQHLEAAIQQRVELAQVQVFAHNVTAIALYTKLGFQHTGTFVTDHPNAPNLLPHTEKWLMERVLH